MTLLPAKEVCTAIEAAYKDFIPKDVLSFSTILDVHLQNAYSYSDSDCELILTKLHEILSDDDELVYEIGWDLPELLLQFFPSKGFVFRGVLAENTKLRYLFKIFEILAEKGNPKELFLKTCELLSSLDFHDDNEFHERYAGSRTILATDDELKEKMINLKFHTIFELLKASYKRIKTNTPSRFLTMIVTSVLNYYSSNVVYFVNPSFTLRRVYTFCRDYIMPPRTEESDIDQSIIDDENYLQSKLLKFLLTNSVEIACRYFRLDFASKYYAKITSAPIPKDEHDENESDYVNWGRQNMSDLLFRCIQLSYSFDIEYEPIFDHILSDTRRVFEPVLKLSCPFENGTSEMALYEEKLTTYIFNLCNNEFKSLIGDNLKSEIPISYLGCLVMYSFNWYSNVMDGEETEGIIDKFAMKDVVLLGVRCLASIVTIRELEMDKKGPKRAFFGVDEDHSGDADKLEDIDDVDEEEEIYSEDEDEEKGEEKSEKEEEMEIKEEDEEEKVEQKKGDGEKREESENTSQKEDNEDNEEKKEGFTEEKLVEILNGFNLRDSALEFLETTRKLERFKVDEDKEVFDGLWHAIYINYLGLLNKHFNHNSPNHYMILENVILLWSWSSVMKRGDEILELTKAKVNGVSNPMKIVCEIYLQCLVTLITYIGIKETDLEKKPNADLRKMILTLVARFLSLSDEEFAWGFIIKCLEDSSYTGLKFHLVSILKDLCSRQVVRSSAAGSISSKMSQVSLQDKPPLPPRTRYINLNELRRMRILRLVYRHLKMAFGEDDGENADQQVGAIDSDLTQLILTYLNFIYSLKQFFTDDELKDLHDTIENCVDEVNGDNNLMLMKLFADRLVKIS